MLVGGLGNDIFTANSVDDVTIKYFNEGIDKINSKVTYILPDNAVFMSLTTGELAAGAGAVIQTAAMGIGLSMTNADIVVIYIILDDTQGSTHRRLSI